jgi:hypothetical protein
MSVTNPLGWKRAFRRSGRPVDFGLLSGNAPTNPPSSPEPRNCIRMFNTTLRLRACSRGWAVGKLAEQPDFRHFPVTQHSFRRDV